MIEKNSNLLELDLKPYGFDVSIQLEGELVDEFRCDDKYVILLFDENHDFVPGIQQSFRNAARLIDEEVIDFIAVEGFSGLVKNTVEAWWKNAGAPSLQDAKHRFRKRAINEEQFIARQGGGFAAALVFFRPDAMVYGIEDPASYEEAGMKLQEARKTQIIENTIASFVESLEEKGGKLPATKEDFEESIKEIVNSTFLNEFISKMKSESETFVKDSLQGERPYHFVQNLFKVKHELSSRRGAILNAGRRDQDVVSCILREDKKASFLRIRPLGFKDLENSQAKIEEGMIQEVKKIARKLKNI